MPQTKRTKAKHAGGRPRSKEPALKLVNFRADRAVLDAIDKLTSAVPVDGMVSGGAKSIAIRRALLDAAARLDAAGGAK